MKNKKRIFLVFIVLIAFIVIMIVNMSRPKDNLAWMEKLISKQIKANETIIIWTQDVIYKHWLVSYVLENDQMYQKVGYAHFIINEDENYELIKVIDADKVTNITKDIDLYEFSEFEIEEFKIHTNFIISNNHQLGKIEQILDNGKVKTKEISENPSCSIFEDLDKTVKVKYRFYDKSGKVIQ